MQNLKNAFTMIEMVFVIVVLGILASVAIPRLAATRDDATITKGIADIASIRSAIVSERQTRLIRGQSAWITTLSQNPGTILFDGNGTSRLLMYGIATGGEWARVNNVNPASDTYTFTLNGVVTTFYYNATNADIAPVAGVNVPPGGFVCGAGVGDCDDLTN